jgi:hypothetical protein
VVNGSSIDAYRDLASALSPPAVAQYLATHDWRLDARDEGVREVWSLAGEEGPPGRVTLVGTVRTLNRGDLGEGEDASIVLAADVSGRRRNVHIPLGGADYDAAIAAHRTEQPLVVTGDLAFERNAWRLGGDVVVDASFIDPDH